MWICVFTLMVGCWSGLAEAQVLFGEVWVNPLGNESQGQSYETIEIANYGIDGRDLSGWSLQTTSGGPTGPSEPEIWVFPAGTIIKAASRLTVYWNGSGENSPTALYTNPGLNLLDNTAGDMALISPEGIEHYLQWGAAGQRLEAAAVAAGKWTAGEFLDSRGGESGWIEGWAYYYIFDPSGETGWGTIGVIDSAVLDQTWGLLKAGYQQ